MTSELERPSAFSSAALDAARVRVWLFGTMELAGAVGAEALLVQPKRMALLAYLCVAEPAGFHRRDRLVALFWPEHRQEHARSALRKALWSIRSALGDDALLSRGDEDIAVNRDIIWCDVAAFAEARRDDRLARALELYRGPLLDGFFADAPEFERWGEGERQRYREQAVECAWALAERYETGDDLTSAARWARRAARLTGGADERVLRRALTLLHRAGDRAGAVQVYDEFARTMRESFGVDPSPETQALIRQIRGG